MGRLGDRHDRATGMLPIEQHNRAPTELQTRPLVQMTERVQVSSIFYVETSKNI